MRMRNATPGAVVRRQRPLRGHRGRRGGMRLRKRREELVRPTVDLVAPVLCDRRSQNGPLGVEHLAVALSEVLEQRVEPRCPSRGT